MNVIENWSDRLDRGEVVGMVALDLKKAFDTVNYAILFNKLKRLGINNDALKWFQSYLQDRVQCTIVNGVASQMQKVECGIPQGSNLGPLLFLVYINDLTKCVTNSNISLYADDTCIYSSDKDVVNVVDALNNDLRVVNKWLVNNKLALNAKKCECLLVGSRKRIKDAVVPDVIIGKEKIQRVKCVKYLGIMIDEHLDWSTQVETLSKKVVKDIYLLRRIRQFIGQKVALMFYKSIIQPKFDYCDTVWGKMGKGYSQKLQILQNRALRSVMQVNWTVPTDTVFDTLQMDRLEDRRIKRVLCFMYKVVYNLVPLSVRKYYRFKECKYNLRQTLYNFVLPKATTEFKRRRVSCYGVKLWNNVTDEIKMMRWRQFRRRIYCDGDLIIRLKGVLH